MRKNDHVIRLEDAFKGYTLDQDKVISPEETVARFKERVAQSGLRIMDETVRIDSGRLGIPVYFSMCGEEARGLIGTRKQMGKGGTPAQAEASAVMELAERFSFFSFYKSEENFVHEKMSSLKDSAISLDLIAASVHDQSEEVTQALEFFLNLPTRWVWAWNLTEDKEVLVPIDWFYLLNEFNGTCAGNCKEEAIFQGMCELVERHVSALVARDKIPVPGIKLETLQGGMAGELIEKYLKRGVRLFCSDFSLGIGIPTVSILAYDPSTYPERSEIVWTAGTASSPQKALIRALTETAQLAGDFDTISKYVASGLPKPRSLQELPHITNPEKRVELTSLPDISHHNIRVEIERGLAALKALGYQVIVVETTHQALKIPAFYIIVPGFHFRERSLASSVGMFTAKLISLSEDKHWALSKLKELDKVLPDKYYIKFHLGSCHLDLYQPDVALRYFDEALLLEPHPEDLPSLYSYKAVCLKELERYKEAIEVLRKAEALDPERPDIYNLMGFCYFKRGKYDKAIPCFERAIEMDPGSAIDYANLAVNHHRFGDREKAEDYYKLALSLDPSLEFAREGLRELTGSL